MDEAHQDQAMDQTAAAQPPQAKRRISRLQHMSISKAAKPTAQGGLSDKLPGVFTHGKRPHDADDEHMQDVQDRPAAPNTAQSPQPGSSSQEAAETARDSDMGDPPADAAAASPDSDCGTPQQQQQQSQQQGRTQQQDQQQHTSSRGHTPSQGAADDSRAVQSNAFQDEAPTLISPLRHRQADTAAAHTQQADKDIEHTAAAAAAAQQAAQAQEQQCSPAADPATAQAAPTQQASPAVAANTAQAGGTAEPAEPQAAAAAAAAGGGGLGGVAAASSPAAVELEGEDDDDDWEDQPAPLLPQEDAGEAEAQAEAVSDSLAERTGPSSRRREQYDDEDQWEEMVLKQKRTQKQGVRAGSSSASGSQAGQESDADSAGPDNILMEDEDATNAHTQRLLRETAARSGFGKGFTPQVAPLDSILGKLQARQAALVAKAAQIPTPPQAAAAAGSGEQSKPVLSLEQVRAHLERHNVLQGRPQHKDKQQPHSSGDATAAATAAAAAGGDEAAADAMELDGDDEDLALAEELDDIDDLVVEPAPQQQGKAAAAAAAGMELPPETQQVLLDELPTLQQRLAASAAAAAGGPVVGTELPADLDLQLGEDDEGDAPSAAAAADGSSDKQQQQQQADRQAGASRAARQLVDAEAAESDGDERGEAAGADEAAAGDKEQEGSGSEGEEEGTEGSEDGSDDEEDDPLADLSLSEEEEEEPSRQQQEPEVEPEPLNWEEEDEELAGAGDSPKQQQQQQGKKLGRVKASKLVAKLRHKAAAYGFIEAEAELSDDEEGGGGSEDEDDDDDQDGMLEELLADATEGRLDEARRAALHARWGDAQESKQIRELLQAIKNGFRRKRRMGAGLDGDEDEDGTDAEARRRRARLLGLADGVDGEGGEDEAVIAGTDRLQRLDFSMRPEDDVDVDAAAAAVAAEQAARQKRQQLHKLSKHAHESQQEGDIMQLLQMDVVDEDSQHTVELLSKSASLPAPAAAAGDVLHSRDLGRAASSRGPSNLRHTSGPTTAGLQASAAAGGRDAAGSRAGAKAGAAASFSFKMFGQDAGSGGGSAALQTSSSFIGRQATSSAGVRSASNYGASRTFVFGSDPSSYSNLGGGGGNSNHGPPQQQQQQQQQQHGGHSRGAASVGGSAAAAAAGLGPSSFEGLGNLIAEAKAGQDGAAGSSHGRLGGAGAAGGGRSSKLLNVLHSGSNSKAAAPASNMITAAVGTKLAGGTDRRQNNSTWQFE